MPRPGRAHPLRGQQMSRHAPETHARPAAWRGPGRARLFLSFPLDCAGREISSRGGARPTHSRHPRGVAGQKSNFCGFPYCGLPGEPPAACPPPLAAGTGDMPASPSLRLAQPCTAMPSPAERSTARRRSAMPSRVPCNFPSRHPLAPCPAANPTSAVFLTAASRANRRPRGGGGWLIPFLVLPITDADF
jgi:hypothetical protein